MKKTVSPPAIHALKEALTHVFWYKRDLRAFVTQTLHDSSLLGHVDWSGFKRNAVTSLIDYMARNQTKHQEDLLALIEAVLQMEDFSHLRKLEDGDSKADKAESAVEALRKHAGRYAELREERVRADARREARRREAEQRRGVAQRLGELSQRYQRIVSEYPQARGYSLEQFLPDLFDVFDIDAKASFRLVGEQIDGAFTFEGLDWLFECKWQQELVGATELDSFGGKIQRKLDNTLGLFLSINGFSPDGITAYSKGRSVMILMDGADLMAVVDGRMSLDAMIQAKRARAARKGEILVGIQELLQY